MTIDECIEIAERECQEPPCQQVAACDEADCCLIAYELWPHDDEPYDDPR